MTDDWLYSNLSPQVQSLIRRLHRQQGFVRRLVRRTDDPVELLHRLGGSGEAAALPVVLPFVFDRDRQVAEAAAEAAHRLALVMMRDDPDMVAHSGYRFVRDLLMTGRGYREVGGGDFDYLESFGAFSTLLLGIASLHWNGYVREVAVRRLAGRSDGLELPFLLNRLNDWVPQVRDAALSALEERLQPTYAPHFARNMELVVRLTRTTRIDHSGFVERVKELLRLPESRSALLECLDSPDRTVRAVCLGTALKAPAVDQEELIERAARDGDSRIRLWAAPSAPTVLAGEPLRRVLSVLERDGFMPVRREALYVHLQAFPETAEERLRSALLDPHRSIREMARRHLDDIRQTDFCAFYRDSLKTTSGRALAAAAAGVGETGCAGDVEPVLPLVKHESSRVRVAAVLTLGRLDRDRHPELFVDLLSDESSRVSDAAVSILSRRPFLVDTGRLWHIFEQDTRPSVRRRILSLIAGRSKWESLPYLVRACCDPQISPIAKDHVNRWVRTSARSFQPPTKQQLAQAEAALRECGGTLDPDVVREIRFAVDTFRDRRC